MQTSVQATHAAETPVRLGVPIEVEATLPSAIQSIAADPLGPCALSVCKRVIDVALAATLLVVLTPLLLLIAGAICIESPGPALFFQKRLGLRGQPFRIIKFRTMRVMEDGAVIRQATRGDPRTTRVGRVLRQTSVDELPQLLNVLLGEMSIVGPRPHAVAHDCYYATEIPEYAKRMTVRPGITGWAQVNGARGETPTVDHMRERVTLDISYLERWSLAFDLIILCKTLTLAFNRRGSAY